METSTRRQKHLGPLCCTCLQSTVAGYCAVARFVRKQICIALYQRGGFCTAISKVVTSERETVYDTPYMLQTVRLTGTGLGSQSEVALLLIIVVSTQDLLTLPDIALCCQNQASEAVCVARHLLTELASCRIYFVVARGSCVNKHSKRKTHTCIQRLNTPDPVSQRTTDPGSPHNPEETACDPHHCTCIPGQSS